MYVNTKYMLCYVNNIVYYNIYIYITYVIADVEQYRYSYACPRGHGGVISLYNTMNKFYTFSKQKKYIFIAIIQYIKIKSPVLLIRYN